MKHRPLFAALLALPLLALPLVASRPQEGPQVGDVAPEISAPNWFNHLGQSPTLASLRGQAVLIDFWATWCGPCVAAWPHLEALHKKYGPDGLVVLGISNEDPKTVAGFIEKNGYTARIAAGTNVGSTSYGVRGIPDTILIDPSGTIVFRGHPMELQEALVSRTVKRARKPDPKAPFRFVAEFEPADTVSEAAAAAARGDLGRAITLAAVVAEAGSDSARAYHTALENHAKLLLEQASQLADRKEARRALDTYALLAKELSGTEFGKQAAEKRKSLETDADFQRELDAADALEKLERKVARLASSRTQQEYRDFAEKYQGTRAGRVARMRSIGRD